MIFNLNVSLSDRTLGTCYSCLDPYQSGLLIELCATATASAIRNRDFFLIRDTRKKIVYFVPLVLFAAGILSTALDRRYVLCHSRR